MSFGARTEPRHDQYLPSWGLWEETEGTRGDGLIHDHPGVMVTQVSVITDVWIKGRALWIQRGTLGGGPAQEKGNQVGP